MSFDFKTTTHGKWILAGEHAVIRGHGALVFPIPDKKLILQYSPSESTLTANYEDESGADTHILFWSVLEQGAHLIGKSLNSLQGHFNLQSNIPIGVGMGASAALCVAVARWFVAKTFVPSDECYPFARELENLFHGQSSGLDIAGVATESGVYFKQGICVPLSPTWHPRWYLSSCAQIGVTSHCIQQVQALWQDNAEQAAHIDEQMTHCVKEARSALEQQYHAHSRHILTKAINGAASCFQQWGLISESLERHMQQLRDAGALAVKPTGSGGGGYVISLWEQEPPKTNIEFISV